MLGALGSISVIWILTVWLLIEAFDRFISPPTYFNPLVMMITAFLGICVNLIMGFTLNQGGHKHFHSHLMGGSCGHDHDHDHGHSHGAAQGDYELMDLEVQRKPFILRSRSMDIKCERNYDKNEFHHHHKREEEFNCCDDKECPEPMETPKAQNGQETSVQKHEHTSNCNHSHADEEAKICKGDTKVGSPHAHDHSHDQGHKQDHDDKHDHDHKHNNAASHFHDHQHGHNHIHDHDQGSNYSIDGMNVNLRAAFVHVVGSLISHPR